MKLDDIPKKVIFDVPEGYFERLPGKIQSRITAHQPREASAFFRFRLQYVIPVLVIAILAYVFLPLKNSQDAESILAAVETEDLIAYLNDSDLTTEDVLAEVQFDATEVQDIEMEVYQLQLEDEVFDQLVDETNGDNL